MVSSEFPEIELSFGFPLGVGHAVAGVRLDGERSAMWRNTAPDYAAAVLAIGRLLIPSGDSAELPNGLEWRRDALGKPYTEWTGALADWGTESGHESHHLHVSNTHDGGMHIVIAAYSADLAGIGIDLVWLPRLRLPGKDRDYLLRFARRFMSASEWQAFESSIDEAYLPASLADRAAISAVGGELLRGAAGDKPPPYTGSPSCPESDESLRLRTAAHFSLMEAASKACGTGLKIGVGMGRETSLPKQSLGALRLEPEVELEFGPEAQARLEAMGAVRYEAFVRADAEMLVSVVALYRG